MRDIHRYPTGARPLLIEETARRRRIEERVTRTLHAAGFAEVILPIIDFAAPYGDITGAAAARQSYRFVDREGDLISLRADFTPMVARALATSLDGAPLPLRVFYRGDVLRCDASRLGANREMFQIGAEIVGDSSPAADIAILSLVASTMRALGIQPVIAYTDASIAARLDEPSREAVITKRRSRDLPQFTLKLIDGSATIDDLSVFAPEAAARLTAIGRALDGDTAFTLHLDDLEAAAPYYTGLRFRVFGGDLRTPVAQGGRYDDLYSRFGAGAPAVGFTFTIDDLTLGSSSGSVSRSESLASVEG